MIDSDKSESVFPKS